MSDDELAQATALYVAGIEAELVVLRRLERLSARQREATRHQDLVALQKIADERSQATSSLVALEHRLKPVRETLTAHQETARRLGSFDDLVALHRAAAHLVAAILASDDEALHALREAELARRSAAHAVEAGQAELGAYQRIIAPPVTGATFISQRR
jgi:hypothetical protein